MQVRNNYDKEIFNGDIGYIEKIDMMERKLTIRFDEREAEYDASELDELVLAYATPVHKAQGAEYPIVVMPILMTHFAMLQRNLLYTGVTRARKALVLIGQRKAIGYCVRNGTAGQRNTLLAQRLAGQVVPDAAPAYGNAAGSRRYICFDVETPNSRNDRMSAIGVCVIEAGSIRETFFSYVNPEERFDRFNTELTGISAETVADAPTFPEVWEKLKPMFESGTPVAHNAPFDLGVLRRCLQDYHIAWRNQVSYLCTVRIGRAELPGTSHRLNDMCRHYQIELDHHQADSDSHACAEILLRYMRDGIQVNRYRQIFRMR